MRRYENESPGEGWELIFGCVDEGDIESAVAGDPNVVLCDDEGEGCGNFWVSPKLSRKFEDEGFLEYKLKPGKMFLAEMP